MTDDDSIAGAIETRDRVTDAIEGGGGIMSAIESEADGGSISDSIETEYDVGPVALSVPLSVGYTAGGPLPSRAKVATGGCDECGGAKKAGDAPDAGAPDADAPDEQADDGI